MRLGTLNAKQENDVGNLLIAMLLFAAAAVAVLVIYQAHLFYRNAMMVYHDFSIKFEGRILDPESGDCACISSFPGKFEQGWYKVQHGKQYSY